MQSKLLIAGAIVVVVLGATLIVSKPKEATAPESDSLVAVENIPTTEPDGTTTIETIIETPSTEEETPKVVTPSAPKPAPAVPTGPTLPYKATVYYDGANFIPEKVVVIQGGTVTFINNSDVKMWIATDNHPTHDRYPVKTESSCSGNAFDQCASVARGGSWTFTFTEKSTWGYHNHSLAKDTGKVVVRTKEEYLEEITKDRPNF